MVDLGARTEHGSGAVGERPGRSILNHGRRGGFQQCLEGMEPDHERKGPGRPRVLPAMALWAGLLVCVLRGFGSQLAVWRLISEHGLWFFPRFPVTDQAVYRRLHTGGTKPLERLFEQITNVLAQRFQAMVSDKLAPFAKEVVCIDESTLDAVSRRMPTLRAIPEGDSRLLPGKLSGAFDVRRQPSLQPRTKTAGCTPMALTEGAGS